MDLYNLQRFIDAQSAVYEQVEIELRAGRKDSHWMWYVFPQLAGLGRSAMAQKFALCSPEEAAAYLDHPVLGLRLRKCTKLMILVDGRPIEAIFGYPDYLKFHSSITLFAHVADDNRVFMDALRKYFRSEFDGQTMSRL